MKLTKLTREQILNRLYGAGMALSAVVVFKFLVGVGGGLYPDSVVLGIRLPAIVFLIPGAVFFPFLLRGILFFRDLKRRYSSFDGRCWFVIYFVALFIAVSAGCLPLLVSVRWSLLFIPLISWIAYGMGNLLGEKQGGLFLQAFYSFVLMLVLGLFADANICMIFGLLTLASPYILMGIVRVVLFLSRRIRQLIQRFIQYLSKRPRLRISVFIPNSDNGVA